MSQLVIFLVSAFDTVGLLTSKTFAQRFLFRRKKLLWNQLTEVYLEHSDYNTVKISISTLKIAIRTLCVCAKDRLVHSWHGVWGNCEEADRAAKVTDGQVCWHGCRGVEQSCARLLRTGLHLSIRTLCTFSTLERICFSLYGEFSLIWLLLMILMMGTDKKERRFLPLLAVYNVDVHWLNAWIHRAAFRFLR